MRLAIHLHLYYCEMWPYIKQYLKNIESYPYDLYVTIIKEDLHLIKQIKQFHHNTVIYKVANRGYDVGPFIYFLRQIKLSNYDLILKLHTKNIQGIEKTCLNHLEFSDKLWSKMLFTALLGSQRIFLRNLRLFKKNPLLGMLSSKYLITSDEHCYKNLEKGIVKEMKRLKQRVPSSIQFVAGTMFLVRSSLLVDLQKFYNLNMFSPTNGNIKDGTLAHVLERIFGICVTSKGYTIQGFDTHLFFEYKNKIRPFLKFFYSDNITSSRHRLIKVLKIPVYHGSISK